jgi:hypothetical protein
MIPVKNTIQAKNVELVEIEAHYLIDGRRAYNVVQHLFDPPVVLKIGETTTITWNLNVAD